MVVAVNCSECGRQVREAKLLHNLLTFPVSVYFHLNGGMYVHIDGLRTDCRYTILSQEGITNDLPTPL